MSETVVVEYELTAEDWISAVSAHARSSPLGRQGLRRARLVFGLIVSALVLLVLWGGSPSVAVALALFGAAWVTVAPGLARRRQRRWLQKLADEGLARGTLGHHRVVLTADGILDLADGYDLLVHWASVERVEDIGGALLVYHGANAYLAIPLSAFTDRSAFEAFSSRFFRGLEEAGHLTSLADGASTLED